MAFRVEIESKELLGINTYSCSFTVCLWWQNDIDRNKYVALTMHFKNIPLVANFCAREDKGSFTIYLTNAEDLSISPHLVLMLEPHSPVNSLWNNCDSLWSDSSPGGINKRKESGITEFGE